MPHTSSFHHTTPTAQPGQRADSTSNSGIEFSTTNDEKEKLDAAMKALCLPPDPRWSKILGLARTPIDSKAFTAKLDKANKNAESLKEFADRLKRECSNFETMG